MKILIKNAKIIGSQSSFDQQIKDILIEDGIITSIENLILDENAKQINENDLHVSLGWFDLKASFGDPGNEHKETISSGLLCAEAGGFTHVANSPSGPKVSDNKTSIEYQLSKATNHVATLHPIGAITKNLEGNEMAEMYDMFLSGARMFSDDTYPLNAGICYRVLNYNQNFGGKTMIFARNNSIANDGMVNDGLASIQTGLKADPFISEVIDLEKTISIAKYTNANLHITGISSGKSVELIKKAKKDGLEITADVHLMNLLFSENQVVEFDTNYKVLPVLRSEKDRIALWSGLKDGTIDAIVSDHRPNDTEETVLEFDNANFGSIQLQTLFGALGTCKEFDLSLVIEKLSVGPRKVYGMEENKIEVGSIADLTLFVPSEEWTFTHEINLSKSNNSPFIHKKLKGNVYGVINNGKLALKEL
jgi:dihydroorotase